MNTIIILEFYPLLLSKLALTYLFLHFEITVINHTQCHLYAWLDCFAMLLSNRTLIPIVVFEEKSVGYSVKTMQYYYAYGWNNLLEKYQKRPFSLYIISVV